MQQKIKLIADSPCDIPDSDIAAYGIELLSVPITIDGRGGYFERKSFTMEGFYDVLAGAGEIPATSRVPVADFYESYRRALERGYTDVICVTINAGGSSTNESAQLARRQFHDADPENAGLNIHIVDSRSYSLGYGWPVIQAARMAADGKSAEKILTYLNEWFARAEIYLGVYTLDYAKRSGRIGAAAAFVGEVLGLRPIIAMIDGETKIIDKVRGDRRVAGRIFSAYTERCEDFSAPVCVVCGQDKEYGQILAAMVAEKTGRMPPVYTAGASIVINAGPRMLAIVAQGRRR